MHHFFFIAALFALTATSSVALAQVPPDIAEGIRKIGPIRAFMLSSPRAEVSRDVDSRAPRPRGKLVIGSGGAKASRTTGSEGKN